MECGGAYSARADWKMYRFKRVARAVVIAVLVLVAMMFVPPVRNVLTLGFLPRSWRDISTLQLLKMQMNGVGSETAALSPCTLPARAASNRTGHRDPLQRLLASEPFRKARARPQDKAAHARALAWLHKTPQRKQRYSRFAPKLSPIDKARILLTWRVMHEALTLHNITHYLVDGTLLGTMRHGGIIPWDDDMDVAVEDKDVDKVRRVLSCIPGYALRVQPSMQWKFFSDNAHVMNVHRNSRIHHARALEENEKKDYVLEMQPYEDVVARAPFVDIFLMTRDDSYTWSLARFNQKTCVYPLDDVYPLTQANFEGYPAPVPRHSASLVKRVFEANRCSSSAHDHIEGSEITDISAIPCEELAGMYNVYRL